MAENNSSIFPDVITPVSNAIHQNIPVTEEQVDGVLSTVVGFFNHVVLYPVKRANLLFQYKLEAFADDLKEKIKDVPMENLQVPPTYIAGPVLEALRYSYDEKELREMYEDMLASSMDNRKANKVHRSYIDAVRQMESMDAKVLKTIYLIGSITAAHVKFMQKGKQACYVNAMPYHFCPDLCKLGDPFQISASISNLLRLGLLISNIGFLNEDGLKVIKKDQFIQERAKIYEENMCEIEMDISTECQLISLDSYGRRFVDICMRCEEKDNAN